MSNSPTDDDNGEKQIHHFNPNIVYEWCGRPSAEDGTRQRLPDQPLSPSTGRGFVSARNQEFWTSRGSPVIPATNEPNRYQQASMQNPPAQTLEEQKFAKLQEKRREQRQRTFGSSPPPALAEIGLYHTNLVPRTLENANFPRRGPPVLAPKPMETAPYNDPDDPDPRTYIDDHLRRQNEAHEQWKKRVTAAREALNIQTKPYPLEVHEIPADWHYTGKQTDKRRKYRNAQELIHRRRMAPGNDQYDEVYTNNWWAEKRRRQQHNAEVDEQLLQDLRAWQKRNGLPREPTPDPAEDSGDGYYNNEFEKILTDPKGTRCRECLLYGNQCSLISKEGSTPPCDQCRKLGYSCDTFLPKIKVRGAPYESGLPYKVRIRPSETKPRPGQAPNDPNLPFVHRQPYRERSPLGKRRRGRPRKRELDVPIIRRSRSPLMDRPTDMGGVIRPFDNSEIESYNHTHEYSFDDMYDAGRANRRGCQACHQNGLECDKKKPCNNCRHLNIQCLDRLVPSLAEPPTRHTIQPIPSKAQSTPSNLVVGLQDLHAQVTAQRLSDNFPSATTSAPGQIDRFAPVHPSAIDIDGDFNMDLIDPSLVTDNPEGIAALSNFGAFNPQQESYNAQCQSGLQYQAHSEFYPLIPPTTTQALDIQPNSLRLTNAAGALPIPETALSRPSPPPDWEYTSKGVIRKNGYMLIDFQPNANQDNDPRKPHNLLVPYPKWYPRVLRAPVYYDSQIPCSQDRNFGYMYGPEGPLPYNWCGQVPSCKCEVLDHSTSETDGHICNVCHGLQGAIEVGVKGDVDTESRAFLCGDCAFDCVGDEDVIKTGDCVCGETMRLNHLCHQHFTAGWLEISTQATVTTEWLMRAGHVNCLACSAKPQDPTSGVWVCKACHSVVKDKQQNAVRFRKRVAS